MPLKPVSRFTLLLVGDSIRQSYQAIVAEALGSDFPIIGMPVDINCRDTRSTLRLLENLDPALKPTCIHWNNGLHDVKRASDSGLPAVPLDEYERNISQLLDAFWNRWGCNVTWCRTTPVIEERHNRGHTFHRFNRDIDAYNAAADAIMIKAGVLVHDLHEVLREQLEEVICEDGVHLTPLGVQLAAGSVVEHMRKMSLELMI